MTLSSLVRLEGEGRGTREGPWVAEPGSALRARASEWTHTHTRTHAPCTHT